MSLDLDGVAHRFASLAANVNGAVQGKAEVVHAALCCLLAEGHLLVEDVPGVGKTSLARAIAASIGMSASRIQFTPDLLPSDVTGTTVYDQRTGTFSFRPGPVFAHLVIADEINRASPKTQSALLEVMQEHTVTVDRTPHPVPRPFMVVATQNPLDMEGTYALPEAQLDRFTMRLALGYPDREVEAAVVRAERDGSVLGELTPVLRSTELVEMIAAIKHGVEVVDDLERYVVDLARHTREAPEVHLGVSPRGAIALLRVARAAAGAIGRRYVTAADVKSLAPAALAHRIVVHPDAALAGTTPDLVVQRALDAVPVPRRVAA